MNVSIFDNQRIRQGLTILLLAGSLACIFPPNLPFFHWWAEHAAFVATGFLLLGLFFLIVNKSRLMFVCLGCSAAICFFKNEIAEPAQLGGYPTLLTRPVDSLPQNQPTQDSITLKSVLPNESAKTRQ